MAIRPDTPISPLAGADVRSAMQLGLFQCAPDDPASSVADTMARETVHSVVVAGIERHDHEGEYLAWGIASDLDLMQALVAGLGELTAGQIAGGEIVTIGPWGCR